MRECPYWGNQEILPCGQGRIDSVKINPSLLMMREWEIHPIRPRDFPRPSSSDTTKKLKLMLKVDDKLLKAPWSDKKRIKYYKKESSFWLQISPRSLELVQLSNVINLQSCVHRLRWPPKSWWQWWWSNRLCWRTSLGVALRCHGLKPSVGHLVPLAHAPVQARHTKLLVGKSRVNIGNDATS